MTIRERKEYERERIQSMTSRQFAREFDNAVRLAEQCSGFMGGAVAKSRFKRASMQCKIDFMVHWSIHQWLNDLHHQAVRESLHIESMERVSL